MSAERLGALNYAQMRNVCTGGTGQGRQVGDGVLSIVPLGSRSLQPV